MSRAGELPAEGKSTATMDDRNLVLGHKTSRSLADSESLSSVNRSSSMGCRVCRARKVKCDGRPNGCRNCERLQLECVDDDGSKSGSRRGSVPVSLRKIRTYRSCTSCRVSKTKCDGDRPRCSRCCARNLDCQYDGGSAPRWARNLSKAPTSGSTEEDLESSLDASSIAGESLRSPSLIQSRENDVATSHRSSTRDTSSINPPIDFSDDTELSIYSWQVEGSAPKIRTNFTDLLPRLVSQDLPSGNNIRAVVDHYFANIHPLRCFAFVHRPSFTRQLDKGFESDDEKALLHIICAQGAKFYALSINLEDHDAKASLIRAAGNSWAQKAEMLVLTNFGKISVQRLMTCILLYDFHFRLGEYTQALMLSGLAVRMAHALQLNVEFSPDILCAEVNESSPPAVEKESRRRLMWACYILDAWTGSGVDQLTLLREADIKIQLPCNERNFRLRIPCVTETLGVGHVLQFLPPAIVPRRPAANMGIMAYYIRIVTLWKRVVRYVKHLNTSPPPWLPESDFAALDADLRSWGRHLPEFISYSTDTIYARLESDQLGSLVLLHCTYHHNLLDLYRISMPDLFKLIKPFYFPPNQQEFLQSLQADCFYHAKQIATILAEAVQHGARYLADSLLPCFAYDSSRVMLYYIARLLDLSRPDAETIVVDAINAVESNSKILRTMAALFPLADSLATTTERWLAKIRKTFAQDEHMSDRPLHGDEERSPILSGSPITSSPDEAMGALGLARLAQGQNSDMKPIDRDAWSKMESGSPTASKRGAGSVSGGRPSSQPEVTPARSKLQHEQPVSQRTPPGTATSHMDHQAVDLSDLQNYLSWDMYGIMEMNDKGLKAGIEDNGMPSWSAS
ncbi:nitrate assimilation regulatory nirA [Fusarium beomiforme]|uniref:Nitrate assimilation regulatory nirA n=1 Tax=Fusarium beomiforme TaxID=44412 RepID=A0A9P5AG63_9HYPO|nr:nitrate assimilation regulatory nirA [Fusarium beomiforme]